jgi:hypothetical protein
MLLKTTDGLEFFCPIDPAVHAVTLRDGQVPTDENGQHQALREYFDDGCPQERLQIVAGKQPVSWYIRPLDERERSEVQRWRQPGEAVDPFYFAAHCIFGIVKIENLPNGVEPPPVREIGLRREVSRDWLRAYPDPGQIDFVGLAIQRLSSMPQGGSKN